MITLIKAEMIEIKTWEVTDSDMANFLIEMNKDKHSYELIGEYIKDNKHTTLVKSTKKINEIV